MQSALQTQKVLWGCLVGLVSALLWLGLGAMGGLDGLEGTTWDWRVSALAKPSESSSDVVLIALDQQSIDWAEKDLGLRWPWPREAYAGIVAYAERCGAAAVGFDVMYTETSYYGVDDDLAFRDAISSFGHFATTVFVGNTTGESRTWPDTLEPHWDGSKLAQDKLSEGLRFDFATFPVPEIADVATVLANVHVDPDEDGIYRRSPPLGFFDGHPVPTLWLGVYLAAHPDAKLALEEDLLTVDGHQVPLDARGYALLRYRGPSRTHTTYTAASILQSEMLASEGKPPLVPMEELEGKYVLMGFTAPGLRDLKAAPISGIYPGFEVHATALDNLLSDDFERELDPLLAALLTLLLALLAGASAVFAGGILRAAAVNLLFVVLPPALAFGAYAWGYWLPLVPLEGAMLMTLAGAGLVNYALEGRQKRFLKNAFKQYLSPDYIEELIAHPDRLKLGGERRVLSIFFSDLEGFTRFSERLDPEELTSLLNQYLSAMTDIIQDEGGTVDKYEGDAIIAFWNAPLHQPDHARRAVSAALRCQQKLAALRPEYVERYGAELRMRIGINTGPAVVGNLGSRTRFDYSMLGDSVNLAARLEGVNKEFGLYTLVSAATIEALAGAFPAREVGRVAVVGRSEATKVFEPLLPEVFEARRDELLGFAAALEAFYGGDIEAARTKFAQMEPADPASAAYKNKCEELGEELPSAWAGVWTMTRK